MSEKYSAGLQEELKKYKTPETQPEEKKVEAKRPQFTRAFNKAAEAKDYVPEEQAKELRKEYADLTKDAKGIEEDLQKKAKKERVVLSHEKILEVHSNLDTAARLQINYEFIQRAFESQKNHVATDRAVTAGTDGKKHYGFSELKIQGSEIASVRGSSNDLSKPSLAEVMSDPDAWKGVAGKRGGNEPRIIVKPIYKEPNVDYINPKYWFGPKNAQPELTNEVEVICIMNNGKDENSNTVVTMVVKHNQGVLEWGDGKPGIYTFQSEAQFKEKVLNTANNSVEDRLARGELTIDEYHRQFKKEHAGKDIYKVQNEHDAKTNKAPDANDLFAQDKITERNDRIKSKDEIIGALHGEYSKQLQELQVFENKILTDALEKLEALNKKNEQIVRSENFKALLSFYKKWKKGNASINKQAMDAFTFQLLGTFEIDEQDLKYLLEMM